MKIQLLSLAALLCLSYSVKSQESLYDFASQEDKDFFKDTFLGSTLVEDFSRAVRKEELSSSDISLKKIGLISFSVFETEFKKEKAHLTYQHQTPSGTSIVQTMYDQSVADLQKSFQDKGISLLLPEDYIQNDQQAEAYQNASKEIVNLINKKIGFSEKLEEYGSKNVPEGYEYIGTNIDGGENQEIANIISELAETLELDGLMTIQILTQYFNYAIAFTSANMDIYISHPIPNEKKEEFGYKIGNYMYMLKAPRGFVGIKKDEVIGEDYSAFPLIISRSGADFAEFLNIELETLFE